MHVWTRSGDWAGVQVSGAGVDDGGMVKRVMADGGAVTIRPARTDDVPGIRAVVEPLVRRGVLVSKHAVAYYEGLQQFVVAADGDDRVVGCGALHVLWDDLAEVRTLAVAPEYLGHGVGSMLLRRVLEQARERRVDRVFCLTFEVPFFTRHGLSALEAPGGQGRLRAAAALLRRGRGGVPRPGPGQAQHPGQHQDDLRAVSRGAAFSLTVRRSTRHAVRCGDSRSLDVGSGR